MERGGARGLRRLKQSSCRWWLCWLWEGSRGKSTTCVLGGSEDAPFWLPGAPHARKGGAAQGLRRSAPQVNALYNPPKTRSHPRSHACARCVLKSTRTSTSNPPRAVISRDEETSNAFHVCPRSATLPTRLHMSFGAVGYSNRRPGMPKGVAASRAPLCVIDSKPAAHQGGPPPLQAS